MVKSDRLMRVSEMEPIAREATRKALAGREQPEHLENLTLGSRLTDAEGLFELYIAGKRPIDARVISRAVVNRETGHVNVEVFLDTIEKGN